MNIFDVISHTCAKLLWSIFYEKQPFVCISEGIVLNGKLRLTGVETSLVDGCFGSTFVMIILL